MLEAISNFKLNNISFKGNFKKETNQAQKTDKADDFQKAAANFLDKAVQDMLDEGIDIGDIEAFKEKLSLEADLSCYFEILTKKDLAKALKQLSAVQRNMRTKDFNAMFAHSIPLISVDKINDVLEKSGVTTIKSILDCANIITKRNNAESSLYGMYEEGLSIYKNLKNKDDLNAYTPLLVDLYKEEEYSKNPDYSILNKYCDFLKVEGIQNFNQIDKFEDLKEHFNNLLTVQDKIECAKFAYDEYQEKLEMLSSIVGDKKMTPEQIKLLYRENKDIISYVYNSGNSEEEQNLADVIDLINSKKKIKLPIKSELAAHFNNFETPKDKIDFYLYLKDCDITASEYANLSKSSIKDITFSKKVLYKNDVIEKIKSMTNFNSQQVNSFYQTHNEILTLGAILQEEDPDCDIFPMIFNFIEKFNIKNSNSLLNQYNTFFRKNEKSLTMEKTLDFLELTKFIGTGNIIEDSRKSLKSPSVILQERKEQYLHLKDQIEEYLNETDNEYLISMTPLEVFNKYREHFSVNPNVEYVLNNVSYLNTQNAKEFEQQSKALEPFKQYFDDKKVLLDFLKNNQIKLDDTQEDNKYRQMCLGILEQVKENCQGDCELFEEKIDYLTQSEVLKMSKSQFDVFEFNLAKRGDFSEIVEILCSKNVKTIKSLATFLSKTQDDNGETKNITKTILNCEYNLDELREIITNIQNVAAKYGVQAKVNNENILNLDIENLSNIKENPTLLCRLFNALKNENYDNFIPLTANGLSKRAKTFSNYEIASELLTKQDHIDSAYENIKDVLGIRLNLDEKENSLRYNYINMISKKLPKEFVDFVNSNSWHALEDGKVANLNLHAKLRAIGRFALDENSMLEDLFKDETKEKLQNLFNTVYLEKPIEIKETTNTSNRFITASDFNGETVEAIFTPQGELITLYPKYSN